MIDIDCRYIRYCNQSSRECSHQVAELLPHDLRAARRSRAPTVLCCKIFYHTSNTFAYKFYASKSELGLLFGLKSHLSTYEHAWQYTCPQRARVATTGGCPHAAHCHAPAAPAGAAFLSSPSNLFILVTLTSGTSGGKCP